MIEKPTVFKSIGTIIVRRDYRVKVVPRPVKELAPREACRGCFFSKIIACNTRMQCSKFDRQDGVSVWFEEIK